MSKIFKSGDGGTDPPASQLPTNYRVKIGVLLCLLAVCIIVGCDRNESPKGDSQEWPADPGSVVNGELPEVASMPDISEYKHPKYSLMGHFAKIEYLDDESARLTLSVDVFDLSSVAGNPVGGKLNLPGIVPGTKETSLIIKKTEETFDGTLTAIPFAPNVEIPGKYVGTKWNFVGHGETDEVIYNCKGIFDGINKEIAVDVEISECKTGFCHDGLWLTDEFDWNQAKCIPNKSPFFVEWETSFMPAEMKGKLSASALLQLILNAPFLPANSFGLSGHDVRLISFNQLFKVISPIIGFSGNEIIMYSIYSWSGNESSDVMIESSFPVNTVTYLPRGDDGEMSVYVNGGGLYDINVCEYRAPGNLPCYYPMNTPDLYGLFSKILLSLSPDVSNGLHMEMFTSDRFMRWSIDSSEDCIELIRSTILPLLQNEVYRQRLLCSIEQNPELSPLLDAVEGGIESFQSMVDASKEMKLGINASAIDNGDLIKMSGFKEI